MNMGNLAPLILFVYNRPWHLKKTLNALRDNEFAVQTDLIVYSDGAKNDAGKEKVQEVRDIFKNLSGFKNVKVIERTENWGLSKSIITGVTEVINKYGKAIILEDDLMTSPYFLKYQNDALNYYQDEDRIISITGYSFPKKVQLPETFCLLGEGCLGWGTWKRAWDLFEENGEYLLKELQKKNLLSRLDYGGAGYYSNMLKAQIQGKNDSWAIRWYASALLNHKFTLHPNHSLIHHIGSDGSGTNTDEFEQLLDVELTDHPIRVGSAIIEDNKQGFEAYQKFINRLYPPFWKRQIQNIIRITKRYKSKSNSYEGAEF